jgi:hypothetical protein
MSIYLWLKDVPELAGLAPQERLNLWKECQVRYARRHWFFWFNIPVLFIFVGLGFFAKHLLQEKFAWSPLICTLLNCIFLLGIALAWQHLTLHRLRRHFREYLETRHV